MRHVDALSRYPVVQQIDVSLLERVKCCQKEDKECSLVMEILKFGGSYKDFEVKRDVLYRFVEGTLLVVPQILQNQIIRAVHELGHISARKTEAIVCRDYSISGLGAKCDRVIKNCVPCILSSRKAGKQEGWCSPIEKYGVLLHTFHIVRCHPPPKNISTFS